MFGTLRCIIKALYKKETNGTNRSDVLLPLDTLYEMVLSHSQFLEVILSDEQPEKKDTKGEYSVNCSTTNLTRNETTRVITVRLKFCDFL